MAVVSTPVTNNASYHIFLNSPVVCCQLQPRLRLTTPRKGGENENQKFYRFN
jgi:hypothetical protein